VLRKALELTLRGKNIPGKAAAFYFVDRDTMADINIEYVGHEGATDVICFNYSESELAPDEDIGMEIFICPYVAEKEALARPESSYEDEIVLYAVHGLLHSAGEDDLTPEKRKEMRKKEKIVISGLKKEFNFKDIFYRNTE
jgi:probable rRNA maturation factor